MFKRKGKVSSIFNICYVWLFILGLLKMILENISMQKKMRTIVV